MLDPNLQFLLPIAALTVLAATQAGEIRGQWSPAAAVKSVLAIERLKNTMTEVRRQEYPGQFDAKTGQFVIPGLKDGIYDLALVTEAGTIEGVNLVVDGDASKELSETDRGQLNSIIDKMDEFMNRKKKLFVRGNGRYAKALMDLCRDRAHHMGDDLIWRVEIWQFENLYGAWQLRGQGLKGRTVLHRVKAPRAAIESRLFLFEPCLGGIRVAGEEPVVLPTYDVPGDWQTHPGCSPVRYHSERKAS